jgi:hypothetical protein
VLDLGDPLVTHSPVLSQAYMLTQTHRHAFLDLARQQQQQAAVQPTVHPIVQSAGQLAVQSAAVQSAAVQLWHFEQYDGEAVFIPGGCPHQVRNLKSCCKVCVGACAVRVCASVCCGGCGEGCAWDGAGQLLCLYHTARDCLGNLTCDGLQDTLDWA